MQKKGKFMQELAHKRLMAGTVSFFWAELLCKKWNYFTEAHQKGTEMLWRKKCVCNILYDEEEVEEMFFSFKQLLRLCPAVVILFECEQHSGYMCICG